MRLQYSAIFQYDSDGINISFPDIPKAITCAYSWCEAIHMAKEVLELVLHGERITTLPTATPKERIACDEATEIVDIAIIMRVKNGILYGYNIKDL